VDSDFFRDLRDKAREHRRRYTEGEDEGAD